MIYVRPRLDETGAISNRDENRNCQHVYMRRYENHKFFIYSPCLPLLFFIQGFVEHALFRSNEGSLDRSEMYCHIRPALGSSRSEDSQLGPASGMTSDRSDNFSTRSHVNICYK